MPKLYAVLLGGSGGAERLSEDHETVFVVAEDDAAAKARAKAKWSGRGRAHVDALAVLDVVDGHAIRVASSPDEESTRVVSYNDRPFDESP
jgi:hypothetical protein